jgi:hypothetical protein
MGIEKVFRFVTIFGFVFRAIFDKLNFCNKNWFMLICYTEAGMGGRLRP